MFLFGFRGFPVWLKYVPGIEFRTDNEPFKVRHYIGSFFSLMSFSGLIWCIEFINQMINLSCNEGGNAKIHGEDSQHDEGRKVV